MITQLEYARKGAITPIMEEVAHTEGIDPELLQRRISEGKIVIIKNYQNDSSPVGIGKGLRTKINASVGTSSDIIDEELEVRKAQTAQENGADTLMDLSVGGDIDKIRRRIIDHVDIPVGNVPLYQAFCEAKKRYNDFNKMDEELLFELIERQCVDGISFMAIHCGINLLTIERLKNRDIVMAGWCQRAGPPWSDG